MPFLAVRLNVDFKVPENSLSRTQMLKKSKWHEISFSLSLFYAFLPNKTCFSGWFFQPKVRKPAFCLSSSLEVKFLKSTIHFEEALIDWSTNVMVVHNWICLPTQNSKNQVEHEKWSNNNEWHEVDPIEGAAKGIIGLKEPSNNLENV